MRRIVAAGLAVLALWGMAAGAARAQTRGETDGCLVTLYNYPAEAPRSDAAAKAPPESLAALKGKRGAGEAGERAPSSLVGKSPRARSRVGE